MIQKKIQNKNNKAYTIEMLESASVSIQENGTVYSNKYNDIYSHENPLQEAEYVFINHNNLIDRWENISSQNRRTNFTIGELGFGYGINFFATAARWVNHINVSESRAKLEWLDYIAVEKHPIKIEELIIYIKGVFKDSLYSGFIEDFALQYPPKLNGVHRLIFPKYNLTLTLLFSDVEELSSLSMKVNAWYFDGFAPNKNPEMWSESIIRKVSLISYTGATFATFSSSKQLQDNLSNSGFEVHKAKGFGNKREMLYGNVFSYQNQILQNSISELEKNISKPKLPHKKYLILKRIHPNAQNIAVIGGGLAGAITANSLAIRHKNVTIFEKNDGLVQEASGNPLCSLYISISGELNEQDRFYLQSHLFAQHYYSKFKSWQPTKLLQIANHSKSRANRYKKWSDTKLIPNQIYKYVHSKTMHKLSKGLLNKDGSIWHSGIANTSSLVDEIKDQKIFKDNVFLHLSNSVLSVERQGSLWRIKSQNNITSEVKTYLFDAVVLCNAMGVMSLIEPYIDPYLITNVHPMRGQSTSFNYNIDSMDDNIVLTTPDVTCIKNKDKIVLNATHQRTDSLAHSEKDNYQNLANLLSNIPESISWDINELYSFVGIRCMPIDRAPFVGLVPKTKIKQLQLQKRKQSRSKIPQISYLQNLYVNFAHASKGFASIPLSSEYIASLISAQSSPLHWNTMQAISLDRLLIRAFKKM